MDVDSAVCGVRGGEEGASGDAAAGVSVAGGAGAGQGGARVARGGVGAGLGRKSAPVWRFAGAAQ